MGKKRFVREGHILTFRETDVLIGLARGLHAREIAEELGVHLRTVENHVEEIRYRLKAKTAAHAVAIGFYKGILEVGPQGHAPAEVFWDVMGVVA